MKRVIRLTHIVVFFLISLSLKAQMAVKPFATVTCYASGPLNSGYYTFSIPTCSPTFYVTFNPNGNGGWPTNVMAHYSIGAGIAWSKPMTLNLIHDGGAISKQWAGSVSNAGATISIVYNWLALSGPNLGKYDYNAQVTCTD